MKVWVKLLLGTILGIILAFFLPEGNEAITSSIIWLQGFVIQIGRYTLLPVIIFSLTIAVYEMREDKVFWPYLFRCGIFLVLSSAVVFIAGTGFIFLLKPQRLPILIESQVSALVFKPFEALSQVFPTNMFSVLVSNDVFLLPICIFSFFLAMGLSYDRNYTKPVISLIDSLSRIFYHILSFFTEILGIILIILASFWTIRFREIFRIAEYKNFIALFFGFTFIMGFVVFPLIVYIIKPRANPWKVLYAGLCTSITSFFSSDVNFSMALLLRHSKENSGIRRRAASISLPVFSMWGHAGSALIAELAFIVIIKSYSSLDITAAEILRITIQAFGISFLLAGHSSDCAFTALIVLASSYGHGFDSSYLLVKPLAFFLISCGIFLDMQITSFVTFMIARTAGFQEDKPLRHFI